MLKISIDLLSARWNRLAIGLTNIKLVLWLRSIVKVGSSPIGIDFDTLKSSNQLPLSKPTDIPLNSRALFVVTQKDFETLPVAIIYLNRNTNIGLEKIDVVTPSQHISECKDKLVSHGLDDVSIISEESVILPELLVSLRAVAGDRFGWIYQQLLKVQMLLNSKSNYTLICDADTLLLRKRKWIQNNSTVLMPSLEFNGEYYNFLSRAFGLSTEIDYSFVAHHMLFDNNEFLELCSKYEVTSAEDFVSKILAFANFDFPSMVSLDYEFYAQYMYQQSPESVFLEKWSNVGLPSKYFIIFQKFPIFRKFLAFNFQSVSFHSWS